MNMTPIRIRLVRRFFTTGETRCPLICVWSLLQEATTPAALTSDEAELPWSVIGALLPWRTLYRPLTLAC